VTINTNSLDIFESANSSLYVIIQARMTSTRLPKKVLLPLCDTTVLEIQLRRLERFRQNIIIATTNDGSEEGIVEICIKNNIRYFRGDTEDVLGRYYFCAKNFGAKNGDMIIRITSDCPFIDSELINKGVELFSKESTYCSNVIPYRTYPRGLDFEIFRFESLEEAHKNSLEREHVTTYIWQKGLSENRVVNLSDSEDFSGYRITLDTQEDYEVIKALYNVALCDTDFDYKKLKNIIRENGQIFEINKNILQKK